VTASPSFLPAIIAETGENGGKENSREIAVPAWPIDHGIIHSPHKCRERRERRRSGRSIGNIGESSAKEAKDENIMVR
jgi:hypothetical protein